MEHLLIQEGGGHHLPFARSRIKQLRATGLRHASRFWLFDDAEVQVRIVEDVEYIRITTFGCVLRMDSGLANLFWGNGPFPELQHRPSPLYETNRVRAYNAPFVVPESGDGTYRAKPATGDDSSGQLSGVLNVGAVLRGRVPIDGATSHAFRPDLVTEDGPPQRQYLRLNDDDLAAKKNVAASCPVSMFTGRTRLYAQAIYGRWLYEADAKESLNWQPSLIVYGGIGSPALALPAFDHKDGAHYEAALLTTSTGLYLDRATGQHWLIEPGVEQIQITPLLATGCALRLRKYLVLPLADGLTAFSEEDLLHLETYILAYSQPDTKNRKEVVPGADIDHNYYGCGYGWHWNWDGTRADIVTNDIHDDPDHATYDYVVSNHWRISLSVAHGFDYSGPAPVIINTFFYAATAHLEGPKIWAPERDNWTICEPLWGAPFLQKTTPRRTVLRACDAPFYAFYRGNALQMCRFKLAEVTKVPLTIEVDPPDYVNAYPVDDNNYVSDNSRTTLGLRGGHVKFTRAVQKHWKCTITCGDVRHENMTHGKFGFGEGNDISTKSVTEDHSAGFFDAANNASYQTGYPPYTTVVLPDLTHVAGRSRFANYNVGFYATFTYSEYNFSFSSYTSSCILIPQHDAEAVWLRSEAYEKRDEVRSSRLERSGQYVSGVQFYETYATSGPFPGSWKKRMEAAPLLIYEHIGPLEQIVMPTQVSNVIRESKLVCRHGVLDAKFYEIPVGLKESASEIVYADFRTLGSAALQNGALWAAPDLIDPKGMAGVPTDRPFDPVFVGWA